MIHRHTDTDTHTHAHTHTSPSDMREMATTTKSKQDLRTRAGKSMEKAIQDEPKNNQKKERRGSRTCENCQK